MQLYQVWPQPGVRTPSTGIIKFTILVEAFLPYITMHLISLRHVRLSRRRFWKLVPFGQFLPHPQGPRGARDLKFTIYVPLVPKMLHTKFEKNWTSSYQEEVENVQLLTDIMYQIWPRPGARTPTPGITKFTILVEAFLLYITMHLVSLRHVRLSRRRFLKIGHFWAVFAPPPGPQGGKRPEIYNLCAPCPKDASYQIWKELDK